MKSLLIASSGFAVAIAFGFGLVLLQPLIETRSHFAGVVLVGFTVLGSVAVGFVPMWLAERLR